MSRWCFVLLSLCLVASSAAAQAASARSPLTPLPSGSRFALLPSQAALPQASPSSASAREEAARAVITALRKRGYQVISEADVAKQLGERLPDGCRDAVTCDPKLALQALGVDAVVSLALWQRRNTATADLVVFVQRHTNYGQAEVALGDTAVETIAADAVSKALEDTLVRHEVTVRIESDPPGASVHVDQSLAGKSPVTLELAPGNHLLIIETPGYVTDAHYVDVPRSPTEPFVHVVKLSQSAASAVAAPDVASPSAPAPASTATVAGTSSANYVLAAALGAIAVPILINAGYAAARDGDCTARSDPQQRCSARAKFGALSWAALGLGLAAGLGAGAVLIFTPFSDADETVVSGAALHLHTHF